MAQSKKLQKNLSKVQDMLDGKGTGKIVVGQYNPTEETRKVGDKWTDSDGYEWEQREGFKVKNSTMPAVGMFSKVCKDCEKPCTSKIDKDTYNRMERCMYCQIDFEARLKTYPIKWWAWVKLQELQRWEAIDKEAEEMILANLGNNPFDKKVANALANGEVEMTIKNMNG
jgi:hypothetical protein